MGTRKSSPASDLLNHPPHVALLRGINVGGKNKLPMSGLVTLFTEAGCTGIRTYIQSGNVVFLPPAAGVAGLAELLTKRIEHGYGLTVPVILRNAQQLEAVAQSNPFLLPGTDTDQFSVAFLAELPAPTAVQALDPNRSPPDQFAVVGREVYMRCPNGFARTKLTNAWLDSKLGTTSTVRNWRTVLTLMAMANE